MKPANYEIAKNESSPECLIIRDNGPWNVFRTITNAAEVVIDELYASGDLSDGQMWVEVVKPIPIEVVGHRPPWTVFQPTTPTTT